MAVKFVFKPKISVDSVAMVFLLSVESHAQNLAIVIINSKSYEFFISCRAYVLKISFEFFACKILLAYIFKM